jgi:hypothetical protein
MFADWAFQHDLSLDLPVKEEHTQFQYQLSEYLKYNKSTRQFNIQAQQQ